MSGSWTEAEMRAALIDHWPYATEDEGGCIVLCNCGEWTSYDLEHILDVLKASCAAAVLGGQ